MYLETCIEINEREEEPAIQNAGKVQVSFR